MAPMIYDQQTRDLAQLAAQRVSDAIVSVLQLCDTRDQAVQVSLMAAGSAMGSATGALAAKHGCNQDDAKKFLVSLLLERTPEDSFHSPNEMREKRDG